jgi:hypothetical protein
MKEKSIQAAMTHRCTQIPDLTVLKADPQQSITPIGKARRRLV